MPVRRLPVDSLCLAALAATGCEVLGSSLIRTPPAPDTHHIRAPTAAGLHAPLRGKQRMAAIAALNPRRALAAHEVSPPAPALVLPPCPTLDNILTNQDPRSSSSNFSREFDVSEFAECEWLFIASGADLHSVLRQRRPTVKRVQLNPAPVVIDYPDEALTFEPHSVNLIDCLGAWLDLTELVEAPIQHTTVVWANCRLILPDLRSNYAAHIWVFDSTFQYPCDVRPTLFLHSRMLTLAQVR